MNTYSIKREQFLPITIDEAWAFFSSAANLSKITPAEMNFTILTKLTGAPISSGMNIEYIVRPLLNIPLHWITEIQSVNAPFYFKDIQIKGPYALWDHTHTFETVPGGVKMNDDVQYALPLGILGTIAHSLVVRKKLENIFNFRKTTLEQLFGKYVAA